MTKLRDLVSSIIFGSTLLYTSSDGQVNTIKSNEHESNNNDENSITKTNVMEYHKKPILILKQNRTTGEDMLFSHRSHRSHSSHRSHYSSRTKTTTPPPTEPEIHELGSRNLKVAMKGEDVLELEKLLQKKGYKIEPDNYFGMNTHNIVKDIQKKNGITDDGVVNTLTLFYIKKIDTNNKEKDSKKELNLGDRLLLEGMSGNDVYELEKLLKENGYSIKPDSSFDEYTTIVVKDYQSKNDIPDDGKVGPLTIYKLKNKEK